ncbi:hypothetical protein DZF91_12380 [Actinomadura logoneensis]|uniref:Uncharacterized protein n=1 Tax=Actinomadura logoneensis TaxID=2293572 RepID=A0A372JPT8_9ACTN|nr:hypothetical protein [Actinomadura logoneensis]RFU41338.1 hypothetical protein DZF91_12380 [Actinomadura logoneensis]
MSTEILTFLLLRLALVAAGVVLLAVVAVTLLVVLKRGGHLRRARSLAEPVVRDWAERTPSGGAGALRRAAVRGALDRLDHDDRHEGAAPPDARPSSSSGHPSSER